MMMMGQRGTDGGEQEAERRDQIITEIGSNCHAVQGLTEGCKGKGSGTDMQFKTSKRKGVTL